MAKAKQRRGGARRRLGGRFVGMTALLLGTFVIGTPGMVTAATPRPGSQLSFSPSNCGGTILRKDDGTTWSCSFDDEFSGTSLDSRKWVVGTTQANGFEIGSSCLMANNVQVANGELRLTADKAKAPFVCSGPYGSATTQYTGAHIGTVGTFSQTYGRFEVRSRFPNSGSGIHTNFWMSPTAPKYGDWPNSGELDISEWWSSYWTPSLPSLHYNGSTNADSGWNCTVATPNQWHTYTLVWLPTRMSFLIDGQTCFTDVWTPAAPLVAPAPFDQPFTVLLSAFVDTDGGNLPTSSTVFPATYEIDYVRAWR